uniref:Uncharacterized protein n=1 Tax=Caenorhabditis tropicalis TaxID=1561998 RepID=A0A1I7V0J8_9PELO
MRVEEEEEKEKEDKTTEGKWKERGDVCVCSERLINELALSGKEERTSRHRRNKGNEKKKEKEEKTCLQMYLEEESEDGTLTES